MSEIDPSFIQWVIGQGVAVGVLMWFMLRNERLMKDLIDKVNLLCERVASKGN
jgi:hypothetical protein